MTCPSCGAATGDGQRFCGSCGASLAARCRTCQAPLTPGLRFCTTCGTPVNAADSAAPRPGTERRLCSVLFVDLVGFTPLSEGRDPEEVRELLGHYFAVAREVVGRYGGTIEKFIGDAVMAVWGTPVAAEGDAERAVRAGLDLIAGVVDLGARIGAESLTARAGIVTGTVATTPAADGQAMVAGDAVNTAARIQSAAPPGAVLVDATTRRLTGTAIAYDEHGEVALKGKAGPAMLWHARRRADPTEADQRGDVVQAPFVGRAVELRLVKDLLHTTSTERRPRLVVIAGQAGVGKSRLTQELERYVEGLAERIYWHRGRCPRFGEDTAYWALAEIVRARLAVADDDDLEVVEDKLARFLHDLFDADADRTYVGTRIARLLGLPDPGTGQDLSQAELFAGWRRFFEGLAERQSVVLVVEDLHDADEGLLDFLEHVVDWTRELPLLVVGSTRPELAERRPGFATGRGRTLVTLTPLAEPAMRELLTGLVADLPATAAAAIEGQAQGIPLFAVETVRSLLDRQLVSPTPHGLSLTGDLDALTDGLGVPETLHALLAARLDALDPVARSLAGDAAVIAAPFTAETIVGISALDADQVRAGLKELVRRDVLQVDADGLAGHAGSYSYAHGMLAQVAYQMLSHRDLKARHLSIAAHLADSPRNEGDALAEVIAWHQLDALKVRPQDPDVESVRASALSWLRRAGERAHATGAQTTAQRLFATAAELVGDRDEQATMSAAELWMRAGRAAIACGDWSGAESAAERAAALHATHGRTRLVAVADGLRGRAMLGAGRPDEARALLLRAAEVLEVEPGLDTVALLGDLSAAYALSGLEEADAVTQHALVLAQDLEAEPLLLGDLLVHRGVFLKSRNRSVEAAAYFRESLRIADTADSTYHRIRARMNIGDTISWADPAEALQHAVETERLARQGGFRFYLGYSLVNQVLCSLLTGDWGLAEQVVGRAVDEDALLDLDLVPPTVALVRALRGDPVLAAQVLAASPHRQRDPQEEAYDAYVRAVVAREAGDPAGALDHALRAAETGARAGLHSDVFVVAWPLAARLAHETGEPEALPRLLDLLTGRHDGAVPPLVRAEHRLSLARQRGGAAAIEAAVEDLRAVGSPYHLGLALLDLAVARAGDGESDRDAVAEAVSEAGAIAAALGATALLRTAVTLGESLLRPPRPGAGRTSP